MCHLTLFLIACIGCFSLVDGFSINRAQSILRKPLNAKVEVASIFEIADGDRKLVDTKEGTIIVTKQGGAFYAVNAKCPHLGLPMKKGAIDVENGKATITCNFHNSKFSLEDGSCTQWCQV